MVMDPFQSAADTIKKLIGTPENPLSVDDANRLLDLAPTMNVVQRAFVELLVNTLFPDNSELLKRTETLGNDALSDVQIASGLSELANQPHITNQPLFLTYGRSLAWLESRFGAKAGAELCSYGRVHLGCLARLVVQADRRPGATTDEARRASAARSQIQSLYGRFSRRPRKPLADLLATLPWLGDEMSRFTPPPASAFWRKLRPTPRLLLTAAAGAAGVALIGLTADLSSQLSKVAKGSVISVDGEAAGYARANGTRQSSLRDAYPARTAIEQLRDDLANPDLKLKLGGDAATNPVWIVVATNNNDKAIAAELARVPGLNVISRSALKLHTALPASPDWFEVADLSLLTTLKIPETARLIVVGCGADGRGGVSRITLRDVRTRTLVHSCDGRQTSGDVSHSTSHYLEHASQVFQDGRGHGGLADLLLRCARAAANGDPADLAECDYVEAKWRAGVGTPASEALAVELYIRAIAGLIDPQKKADARKYVELKRPTVASLPASSAAVPSSSAPAVTK